MLEAFADFDLSEEESPRGGREDRIRAAFEKSKLSYVHEQVFTEPGWYDPPIIPSPTKLHVRNIDFSLHSLYLKREYSKALTLALSQIEVEESNSCGEGREFQLIDLAIRCALKIGDNELAGQLSDKTVKKWSSNVGLATTAAEAYLSASRPRDALNAILIVISIREPSITYVHVLIKALEGLSQDVQDSEALEAILSVVRAHIFHRNSGGKEPQIIADEASATLWLQRCAILGEDQQRLLKLLCHRASCENDGAEGRSVRTL